MCVLAPQHVQPKQRTLAASTLRKLEAWLLPGCLNPCLSTSLFSLESLPFRLTRVRLRPRLLSRAPIGVFAPVSDRLDSFLGCCSVRRQAFRRKQGRDFELNKLRSPFLNKQYCAVLFLQEPFMCHSCHGSLVTASALPFP